GWFQSRAPSKWKRGSSIGVFDSRVLDLPGALRILVRGLSLLVLLFLLFQLKRVSLLLLFLQFVFVAILRFLLVAKALVIFIFGLVGVASGARAEWSIAIRQWLNASVAPNAVPLVRISRLVDLGV